MATTTRPGPMSAEEVLTTTRAVRRRLDLTRPVDPALLRGCVETALQAPTGGNAQNAHFVVVTQPERRAALAEVYRRGWAVYETTPVYGGAPALLEDPVNWPRQREVLESALHLVEHMHEVPALVVPCIDVGLDRGAGFAMAGVRRDAPLPVVVQSAVWGGVMPTMWSFMLAARARGLASCWTCVHLFFEQDAAELLGIPYEQVWQAGIIPVAHTSGTFRPARRRPLGEILHWEGWG